MTAHTLSAVLWDMDGTLVDTEPLWLRTQHAMLERYGLEMTAELHRSLIGSGLWDAAEGFRRLGVPLSADEIVAEQVAGVAAGIEDRGLVWRPGARELLGSLREAGVPCALVTMSVRSLAEQVAALLPEGTFSAIVAGDEVDYEKPHPQPYLLGAEALDAPIERCLAFEDSPTGLRSATAAGAVAIGVPNLLPLGEAPAHALFETLDGVDAAAVRRAFTELRGGASPSEDLTFEEAAL